MVFNSLIRFKIKSKTSKYFITRFSNTNFVLFRFILPHISVISWRDLMQHFWVWHYHVVFFCWTNPFVKLFAGQFRGAFIPLHFKLFNFSSKLLSFARKGLQKVVINGDRFLENEKHIIIIKCNHLVKSPSLMSLIYINSQVTKLTVFVIHPMSLRYTVINDHPARNINIVALRYNKSKKYARAL